MQQINLDEIYLDVGLHSRGQCEMQHKACFMEWVSVFAGEEFSDSPACTSPLLASFLRGLNDSLDSVTRQKLKKFIPEVIGTADDGLDEQRRYVFLDWLIRKVLVDDLTTAGLHLHALRLSALAPIRTQADIDVSLQTLDLAGRAISRHSDSSLAAMDAGVALSAIYDVLDPEAAIYGTYATGYDASDFPGAFDILPRIIDPRKD